MEATLIKEVAVAANVAEKAETLTELSTLELMLVGGGIANVHFA